MPTFKRIYTQPITSNDLLAIQSPEFKQSALIFFKQLVKQLSHKNTKRQLLSISNITQPLEWTEQKLLFTDAKQLVQLLSKLNYIEAYLMHNEIPYYGQPNKIMIKPTEFGKRRLMKLT